MNEHWKCFPAEEEADSFSVATDDIMLKRKKTATIF